MESATLTSRGSPNAVLTERPGSYPTTSIPNEDASRAVAPPMCPKPITANVFPRISRPPKRALSFSTRSLANPCDPKSFMWLIPSTTRRLPNSKPQSTNSLTALALAPGVLNTGIPNSVMRATGMLFVPAPHLAMARTDVPTSSSFSLCDRSSREWAGAPLASSCGNTSYKSRGNRSSPFGEILLKVWTQYFPGWVKSAMSSMFQPDVKWS
mmetsp:Transcript_18892/g.53700  ORF Transcript_18892/g.53700 Transcript_18892/m.53700 type:complete len:211 (+) Transcript_18892:759-1391(+)